MLFERTCRIKQDFDWFLRFVPPNSVEKRKISKHHPETCTKTGSTILSPACLEMFEPSKTFFMFLFVIPANQTANAAPLRLKSKNHPETCTKKQAARFFRLPVWRCLSRQRLFPCFFMMSANQKCQHCTIAIEKQKSASIIQKPAQKNRQHDSFACLFGDI